MQAGLANAAKTVAIAATIALALWLAQADRKLPGGPQPVAAPVPAEAPAMAQPTLPLISCEALRTMTVPVQGVLPEQLSDTFNDARSQGRRHDALDIMAPLGTPVIAAAPGKVEKLFLSDAGGNTVYVRSPDQQVVYYYAHLDRYAPGLAEGQQVAQGSAIGTVGFTGNANPAAPHLHFAILATTPDKKWWEAKQALNPYPMLAGRTEPEDDQALGGCRR